MKAIFKPIPQLAFEVTGEDVKALFKQISEIQEVFAAESKCGMCGSCNLGYSHRHIEDFDYYELRCLDCRADFKFGQAKKGGRLFPKRKDDDGRALPNGGWSRYEPGQQAEQQPAPRPQPQPISKPAVPAFRDWQTAQNDKRWGQEWLEVGGNLYELVDGKYKLAMTGDRRQ